MPCYHWVAAKFSDKSHCKVSVLFLPENRGRHKQGVCIVSVCTCVRVYVLVCDCMLCVCLCVNVCLCVSVSLYLLCKCVACVCRGDNKLAEMIGQ